MGQIPRRASIETITRALPCLVTTSEDHAYPNKSFVRLTNLNGMMPLPTHGMDELNNRRFRIILTGLDSFYLQDPITFEPIDSRNFPDYTEGGFANLIVHDYIYVDNGDNNGES